MGNRQQQCSSLELAVLGGLVVVRTSEQGVVRLEDPVLWIGPEADENLIATIACRRLVQCEDGEANESTVRERVELEGFVYKIDRTAPGLRSTSPRAEMALARTVG